MPGVWSFDTETELMRPGAMAPPLVCLTHDHSDYREAQIVMRDRGIALMGDKLANTRDIIVGQNVAYDLAVMCAEAPALIPYVFQAYEDNRITDTMIRQQLMDIGNGCYRGRMNERGEWIKYGYSLFDLVLRYKGQILKKDGWRLRYGEFRELTTWDQWIEKAKQLQEQAKALLIREAHKPEGQRYYDGFDPKDLMAIVNDDPQQVIKYPLDDASTTLDVYLEQEKLPGAHKTDNQYREARAAWFLHLSTVWGIRTNKAGVDALEKQTVEAVEEVKSRLMAEGLVRADGSRDTKKAAAYMVMVCQRDGLNIRKTKAGGVCLDAEACEATEDSLLEDYSEYTTLGKTLNADIPMLRNGTTHPIHAHYGLADTSRTTCSGPNLQNLRKLPGIREAIQPRPGRVFIQADFPQLELFTLAEVCYSWFGHSALGDMLKAGVDPHTSFAATLMGISYEEGLALRKAGNKELDRNRQVAKAFNFGSPGGLGATKLVTLAASPAYRVAITENEARKYKKVWTRTFPEMKEYFERVNQTLGPDGTTTVEIPNSGHVRGGARYCAACNTPFQGLGAACAKNAGWLITKAQYVERKSPLFGSRMTVMVHDEYICEAYEDERLHDAAMELARLMVEGANKFLPHCPIPLSKMEPLAMRYWSKDAKPVFDKNGRIIPWSGEEKKAA